MATRTAIFLIMAFIAAVSEGQQQDVIKSSNSSMWTVRDRHHMESEMPLTTASTTTIDVDDLVDDGLCRLTTTDPYVHNKVVQLLTEEKVTLIEYQLNFTNYSYNPLTINVAGAYDAKKWARVTTAHGQTLLSLAFNYGVLSMMTLTLGTETLAVELQDSPPGCMATVSDRRKINSVRRLLMRDFDSTGPIATVDDARVCNEIILDEGGYAKFRHKCCFKNSITGLVECTTDIGNIWLQLLYAMLTIVRLGLVFFGPYLFTSAVLSMSKDTVPYVVKLKSKLQKTVCFYRGDKTDIVAKQVLDLSSAKGFPKLRKCFEESGVALGQPLKVRFSQYDINVDYKRMQKENVVHVGLFYSIFSAIFRCQVRFLSPFKVCCKVKMLRWNTYMITWGRFCKRLVKILLILLVPTPFYLRLVVFYVFEYDELQRRKSAIDAAGLTEQLESSLLHFFTPTHGLFICMYILYIVTAVALAFISQKDKDHRVKKVIINSFRELKGLNFTDTLSMMASNMVWPLENFGALGCCVGIIYWPLAIIGNLFIGAVYLLPTLYLTFRMSYHSKLAAVVMSRISNDPNYRVRDRPDLSVYRFRTEKLLRRESEGHKSAISVSLAELDHFTPQERNKELHEDAVSIKSTKRKYPEFSWQRIIKYVSCAFLGIMTLYSVVLIMSEVIGCLIEIAVFTIMGCIVNASALLKYVMLIIMILVYCGDCFNGMEKKYLKMNRALFNELKFRVQKDLEKVTSLPADFQENTGFKAQEINEQGEHEAPDDVVAKPAKHWKINDLVLFVDNEDTPRIPIQLFNDVICIRVAGVPGPIYRGHIEAFKQLSKIVLFVVFVFLVVLSFGSVHKISATNQTLATLVGGFLPRMLRMFLAPPRPEVELGTVSFKSKMDEIIKNFYQYWPIYDLPFEVDKDEDESAEKTDSNDNKKDKKPSTEEKQPKEEERMNELQSNNKYHCDGKDDVWFDDIDGNGGNRFSEETSEMLTKVDVKKEGVALTLEGKEDVELAICLPSVW